MRQGIKHVNCTSQNMYIRSINSSNISHPDGSNEFLCTQLTFQNSPHRRYQFYFS